MDKNKDNCEVNSKSYCPIRGDNISSRLKSLEDTVGIMAVRSKEIHDKTDNYLNNLNEIVTNQHEDIGQLKDMFKDIMSALNGVMNRPGLIDESSNHELRILNLENWRREIKSFVAGVIIVCSIVSSAVTFAVTMLINYLK